MTLAETIYQKSLSLPEEKARAVLNFIDALQQQPKHTDVHPVDGQNSSLLAVFEKSRIGRLFGNWWTTLYELQDCAGLFSEA